MTTRRVLDLVEFQPAYFEAPLITEDEAEKVLTQYAGKLELSYPTPLSQRRWRLQSSGWVGTFPIHSELHLRVSPKVAIRNLFGMWEYAYRLKSFKLLNGLDDSDTIEGFYAQLARVLASKVLDRERRGLAREYISLEDHLPYVTGRLNVQGIASQPWSVSPKCQFHEHTADVEDNRLLAWTLSLIARSVLCSEHAAPTVRQAYRALRNIVSPQVFAPSDCVERLYSRLTQDYQPMHALCRFFLEHSGPTHDIGDHVSLPFAVDMAGLFEMFVAGWLSMNLPQNYSLQTQERVNITSNGSIRYAIDLVLYQEPDRRVLCVLDTKYKMHEQPSNEDLNQMVVYASLKKCRKAVLIYPSSTILEQTISYPGVDIYPVAFNLQDDIDKAGHDFLSKLMHITGSMVVDL
jgi:5-methylcytosine-specific restriction enzyme subunit McrC